MPELIELIERAVPEASDHRRRRAAAVPARASTARSFVELIGGSVMRPIEAGVTDSLERFRELLADGRVKAPTAHRDAG